MNELVDSDLVEKSIASMFIPMYCYLMSAHVLFFVLNCVSNHPLDEMPMLY